MPRAAAVVLASGWLAACGPSLGSGDGGGSASAGSGSGSSGPETTVTAESGTTADVACPSSDLPEPFCHVFMPYDPPGRIHGVLHEVRNGVRPLVAVGDEEFGIRLLSPLDPAEILDEGPAPFVGYSDMPILAAELTGDGAEDLAFYEFPTPGEIRIVDGASFEHIATLGEPPSWFRQIGGGVDVDGDGVDELVIGEYYDDRITLNAWRLVGQDLVVARSYDTGVGCTVNGIVVGDFNGDGRRDLAFAWPDECEPYLEAGGAGRPVPREITTLLAASEPGQEQPLVYSAQPVWAQEIVAGDLDGDGDDEVVLGQDFDEIVIMDWSDGHFQESERLRVPDEYPRGGFALYGAGNFAASGHGGGIFVGQLRHPTDGVLDGFVGALFRSSVMRNFVEMPNGAVPTADFDAEGVADIGGSQNGEPGIFLSAWAQL